MEIKLDKNQRIAAAGTFVVSALIVLLLMLLSMTPPYPPEELPGMEVSLGNSITGSGQIEPEDIQSTSAPQPTPTSTQEDNDVVTDDNSDVQIDKKVKQQPQDKPADVEPEETQVEQTVNNRALFDPTKISSQGGSQGNDNTPGNVGNPNGSRTSSNPNGSGGSGGKWSLVGRNVMNLEPASTGFTESGKVTVKIYVNRQGKVIKAEVQMKGTKTNSEDLHRRARQAALRTTFNIKADAPEMQVGTITYNFVLQN